MDEQVVSIYAQLIGRAVLEAIIDSKEVRLTSNGYGGDVELNIDGKAVYVDDAWRAQTSVPKMVAALISHNYGSQQIVAKNWL